MTPAAASASRYSRCCGWTSRLTASKAATQADTKIVSTTAYPAHRSPRSLRSQERDREGDRRERVAAVVDQVGEERNRTGQQEHDGLEDRGDAENREADGDRTYAGARSDDRTVDGTVGVRVPVIVILIVVVIVIVIVIVIAVVARLEDQARVAMRSVVVVLMGPGAVPVCPRPVHVKRLRTVSSCL